MEKYLLVLLLWCLYPNSWMQGQNVGNGQTCLDCHNDKIANQVIHMPAEESCDYCHEPTGEDHPDENVKGFTLLESLPDLCYMCHEESQGNSIHAPVEYGECLLCHSPHSSTNLALLPVTPVADLCFECHDSGSLEAKETINGTNFRNGDQNLHYLHINGDKGRSCKNCHDLHGSSTEHLIAGKVSFGKWEMPLKLPAQATGYQ